MSFQWGQLSQLAKWLGNHILQALIWIYIFFEILIRKLVSSRAACMARPVASQYLHVIDIPLLDPDSPHQTTTVKSFSSKGRSTLANFLSELQPHENLQCRVFLANDMETSGAFADVFKSLTSQSLVKDLKNSTQSIAATLAHGIDLDRIEFPWWETLIP
ncbi:hypothetical protein BDV19DRAFT_314069 [Aspergillus venezuelensis]